jgi:hypothetical protein
MAHQVISRVRAVGAWLRARHRNQMQLRMLADEIRSIPRFRQIASPSRVPIF